MAIIDSLRNIPTWGYAAGGIFVVGLVFLLTRSGGGTAAQSTGMPAADINDILNQLQDAANQLGGSQSGGSTGGSTGGTTTTPPPKPIQTLIGYKATFLHGAAGKTPLYDAKGKFITYVSGFTTTVGLRKKIGGHWAYMITSGKHKGQYIIYGINRTVKLTAQYQTTQAPATTSTTTAAVPTSNNAVA